MNVFSCLLNSVQLTSFSRRLAGRYVVPLLQDCGGNDYSERYDTFRLDRTSSCPIMGRWARLLYLIVIICYIWLDGHSDWPFSQWSTKCVGQVINF